MARNIQYICGTVLLCIVILFVTGVTFPKYIESRNIKKRAIFNSSMAVFKLVSKAKLISNLTDFENTLNSSIASEETKNFSRSSFPQSIAFDRLQQTPVKGKRLKRDTASQKNANELLSWDFNLNVSRSERTALHDVTKTESVPSDRKNLGVSVYVNSRETQETAIGELQRALDSLSSFIRNVFGSGSVNKTYNFKGIDKGEIKHLGKESESALTQYFNIRSNAEKRIEPETVPENHITQSFQEASPISELVTAQNPNPHNLGDKNKNESLKTERKARIFFNIFDLKGKFLGRTSVSEIETTKHSVDIAQTETNILRGENIPTHLLQQKSEWVTENSNQETGFNSDSLESSEKLLEKQFANDDTNLSFQQTTQLSECSGCVTGGLEFQSIPNKEKSENTMLETMDSTETSFTDEILEKFCKSIPNDLAQSHLSPLTDEESETNATIESSVINNEDTTQLAVQTDKESKFLSLFDSGSGRSDIVSDEKNLTSFEHTNEFSKFPSISDCILFFSKKQKKIVLKPNDMNDLENKIFSNLENNSVISNFEEQLKFPVHLNSSVQTFDEIPESTEIDLWNSKTSLGDENNFTIRNLSEEQEKSKNFNVDNRDISENTDSDGVEKISNDRRDGKFLSFFGFGSGNDDQENGSLSERFFNSFFSSGARSLEDSGHLEETVNLGSDDTPQDVGGFSGDGMFPVSDRDPSVDFSIASGEDPRFLSLLGFAGSGDGRELTENSEIVFSELSDTKCSNCSYGVQEFHKCDDFECNFENAHDLEDIDSTESGTYIPFNESDCRGDCYPNAVLINRDNSSISSSETSNKSIYFSEKPQKCSCFRGNNFTDKIESIPECDCISSTLQASDAPYVDPKNNFSIDPTGIKDEYEKCNDCNHKKFSEKPILTTPLLKTSELTYEIKTNDSNAYKEIEGPSYLDEVNSTDFRNFSLDFINTEESQHQVHKTTVMKPRHFVGTIFLTGSGDGGLFGDDSRPINLEEEVRSINPLLHSRRRGRLDDLPDLSEVIQEKGLETPQTNQNENNFNSSSVIQFGDETSTSPISISKGEEITLKDPSNTENITFPPVTVSNEPSSNAPPDLHYRPCVGAIDCNATLGERCIKVNSSSVCECARTFVRQKLTGKCVAKRQVETSIKLSAEIFHSDLRDPDSARYKSTSKKSVDTMWLLLNETSDQRIVNDISVSKFTAGSLIVSMYLVLAVDNESQVELLIKGLEEKLKKALLNENLMKRASLNIRNATVLSVTELDPCMLEELNYCSRNAYCKRKEGNQGSYTCYCKEHFLDVSSDPLFPGEKCIECPTSYCGPNGYCEIINNERHCLCNGMYFGERCEIPGMVILCSLTVTAFVSLIVLCAVIIKLRCRKTSYGGSPTFHRSEEIGPHTITAGRVSDAIALVENPGAKVSKFAQISTPVIPPMIKITQPTLNESSISFECDSSFDVTSTQEQAGSMEN